MTTNSWLLRWPSSAVQMLMRSPGCRHGRARSRAAPRRSSGAHVFGTPRQPPTAATASSSSEWSPALWLGLDLRPRVSLHVVLALHVDLVGALPVEGLPGRRWGRSARRTGARQHRRIRRTLAPAGRESCDLVYPATSSAAAIDEGTLTTMKTIDANRGSAAYFNIDRSILANHRHGVPYTL